MNPKFQATAQLRGDVTLVKLAGVIDEDNTLAQFLSNVTTPSVVIDLGEVTRINSCGVRDWVSWLAKLEKAGASKIIFIDCSPAIIAQVNLLDNFTASGGVKSFYAPYFCPACQREKLLLLEARDLVGSIPPRAPLSRCDECDGMMDFDDLDDAYFAFLAHPQKVIIDNTVEAAIREFTPSTGEDKLKLRSNPGNTPAPSSEALAGGISSSPSLPSSPMLADTVGHKLPAPLTWALPNEAAAQAVPTEPPSVGAWIVVGILLAIALALLAYVFVTTGAQ